METQKKPIYKSLIFWEVLIGVLVLLGIDAFLADAFTGAIIIAAVLMQRKDK